MDARSERLPFAISSYIQSHFQEDFLCKVRSIKSVDGHLRYALEVTKDDHIHNLTFNEDGKLLQEEAEQAFPPDTHDGVTLEDTPE